MPSPFRTALRPATLLAALALGACSDPEPSAPLRVAAPGDFDDPVDATAHEGLELSLWAPRSLLASPVAIDFDDQGRAYVTQTTRRKSSDLDIREHGTWMEDDLGLRSLADKEAFLRRVLDPAQSDENTWMEDFNEDGVRDYQDLGVQSEIVHVIEDTDGDGRADRSRVFAEGFDDPLTGVAAGVLAERGDVFVTAAPDVWRLHDTDGDLDADERRSIAHGFGIHIGYAGHDMSGLVMGPDGKVYWSIGDLGVDVTDADGKRWAYPHHGAVMRANPDGSAFEVFAHGLRNPQELAFDAYGNLFSVDNDGDRPGERERYVYLVDGSDSGWRIHWQYGKYGRDDASYNVWMAENLHLPEPADRPAYALPPIALAHDGPAGLVYNPGTALNERWADTFFGSFFKGSAAQSKIHAFRFEPEGASFRLTYDAPVLSGIVATGLAVAPGGGIFLADWLETYDKKPIGRVWKLDVPEPEQHPLREETERLLAEGMGERALDALGDLLAFPDMRVRMAAQFELVDRDARDRLQAVLERSDDTFARLHALWGLGQIARADEAAGEALVPFLEDADAEIRAQTAEMLGDASYAPAADALLPLLTDAEPRVRFFAAQALGRIGDARAFEPLVDLLARTADTDPYVRHAASLALARLGDADALADLSDHSSAPVRLGAVLALRRLQSPHLARFLTDADPRIVSEAARAIHDDDSVEEALPALATLIPATSSNDEALLRRALNANFRLGDAASAERLAQFAARETAPVPVRAEALTALRAWPDPPALDAVEGTHRVLGPRDPALARTAVAPLLPQLLATAPDRVRLAAASTAGALGVTELEPDLFRLAMADDAPGAVRAGALQALGRLGSERTAEAVEQSLDAADRDVRLAAQQLMATLDLPPPTVASMLRTVLESGALAEQQSALAALGDMEHEAATLILGAWIDRLLEGDLDAGLQLDLLMAAQRHEELARALADYEARRSHTDPLAPFAETLYGGDARRGRTVMAEHQTAQCLRCHAIQGYGGEVGPELTAIGAELDRYELLQALVEPSARLAPGYGTVTVTLTSGETITGTVGEETDAYLEVSVGGEERRIMKEDVAERRNAPSAMPPMGMILTKPEIRDLIEFMTTLKGSEQ